MDDLRVQVISTPPIEKILEGQDFSQVFSWSFRRKGHRFYGITMKESNLTLVYDLDQNLWYQWTDVNGNYWPIVDETWQVGVERVQLAQHESNGKLYTISTGPLDDGEIFPVDIHIPNFDGGTDRRKTLNVMFFNADQTKGSRLLIRHSEDDYETSGTPNAARSGPSARAYIDMKRSSSPAPGAKAI